MTLDEFDTAPIGSIALPYELLEYQRFLSSASSEAADAYLFFESRVRFSAEADDLLVQLAPISVKSSGTTTLSHEPTRTEIALPNLDRDTATRIMHALRDQRSLVAAQFESGCSPAQMHEYVKATLGRVLFLPKTLARLEARISGTEIVRFVGSPYEIQRNYWHNMADCRARILARLLPAGELANWVEELRLLHVVALIGAEGRTFYRPQSPLGHRDARPGAWYTTPSRRLVEGGKTWFIDGPRISAPMVGGSAYHEALCRAVGDPDGLSNDRAIVGADGTDWGGVWMCQAQNDTNPAPWFCPPRPIRMQHFQELFERFRTACSPSASTRMRLEATADFHWQFVRLHPFRCANQSLGMNIVNALRLAAEQQPIPHLLLDQLALRITREAYRRVFSRASEFWSEPEVNPLERWRRLAERRQLLDRFVARLGECNTLAERERWLRTERRGAELALLFD